MWRETWDRHPHGLLCLTPLGESLAIFRTLVMKFVTRDQMIQKIKATNGRIMSILYRSARGDNHVRRLNCKTNVTKYLTGTGKAAPASAKVITVYDLVVKNYRSLAFEGIIQAQINGEVYEVKEPVTV